MKRVLVIFFILFVQVFAEYSPKKINKDIETLFKIVPRYEKVEIKGEFHNLDMKKLMQVTAMVESSYGTTSYSRRIPKTYMQMEKRSALHSLSQGEIIKKKIERRLGRNLQWDSDKDAMFVAYIIYTDRLRQNKRWLRLHTRYFVNGDVEWYIYKVFFNSIKGSATHKLWQTKQKQLSILTGR
ncbi:MAG: hypothetical protein ACRCZ1_03390 [Cetobacterium sp.]